MYSNRVKVPNGFKVANCQLRVQLIQYIMKFAGEAPSKGGPDSGNELRLPLNLA